MIICYIEFCDENIMSMYTTKIQGWNMECREDVDYEWYNKPEFTVDLHYSLDISDPIDWFQIEKQIKYFFTDPKSSKWSEMRKLSGNHWIFIPEMYMKKLVKFALENPQHSTKITNLIFEALWRCSGNLFDIQDELEWIDTRHFCRYKWLFKGCTCKCRESYHQEEPYIFKVVQPLMEQEAKASEGKISLQRIMNTFWFEPKHVEYTEDDACNDEWFETWSHSNRHIYESIKAINYLVERNPELFVNDTTNNFKETGWMLTDNLFHKIEY